MAGTNKTYTLQVALDVKNFLESPSVKLKVNNEGIKGETDWVEFGKDDLIDIKATYIDEKTGEEISPAYQAQGYSISRFENFDIQAREIEGYKLVSAPDMAPYLEREWLGDGQKAYDFVFKYQKITSAEPDNPGGGSETGNNSGTGGQGSQNQSTDQSQPSTQNLSAAANTGKTAKTGDTAPVLPLTAVAVISLAGVAVIFKKKREVK